MNNISSLFSSHSSHSINANNEQEMGSSQNPLNYTNVPMRYPSLSQPYINPLKYNMPLLPPPVTAHQLTSSHQSPSHSPYPFLVDHRIVGLPYFPSWRSDQTSMPSSLQEKQQLSAKDEKRHLAAIVARNKRKLARQRSLINKIISGSSPIHRVETKKSSFTPNNETKHLFSFCTPDDRKLRMLITKELKNSDVGSLGRIILPKRDTEENLPALLDKEGIKVTLTDVNSDQGWLMKFKYWINNKSRMYVLENTGEFVKRNGMKAGDILTIYEDQGKNLYFCVKKAEIETAETSNQHHLPEKKYTQNYLNSYPSNEEEDDASLALLIEQLTQ